MRRTGFAPLALASSVLASAAPANAQQYLVGGEADLSPGMEGGGQVSIRPSRLRLRLGGDARVDESPDDILQFGLLAELVPRAGFGGDVRYARMAGEHFVVDIGGTCIVAPSSIYGVTAGLTYRWALSKRSQVTFGPEGDFYFLGTDLPSGVVIWQARFMGGFRVDL